MPKVGPWRMVRKYPIRRYEIRKGYGDNFEIVGVYIVLYRRSVLGKTRSFEERKDEIRTVPLRTALEKIYLTPQHDSIVAMTTMGLGLVEKVFDRFNWYCEREEDKKRKQRQAEWKGKKNIKRTRDRQFARRVEL